MARTVSPTGLQMIADFEGFSARAYRTPGLREEPWTIGYGHTGPDVVPGRSVTKEEALDLLSKDVKRHARQVEKLTKGSDTPAAAFDALVSFDFNTGALGQSTLLRKHLAGEHAGAEREFHRWFYASGKPLRGLKLRRAKEAALYYSAYKPRPPKLCAE